jgi:starch synthase
MTIHNMAFQGYYRAEVSRAWACPQAWSMTGVEYHGGVGFLKAGLEAASAITTVSPTYAREIRDAEFGMGLEGPDPEPGRPGARHRQRHRHRAVESGDRPALAARFTASASWPAQANKRALEAEFGSNRATGRCSS